MARLEVDEKSVGRIAYFKDAEVDHKGTNPWLVMQRLYSWRAGPAQFPLPGISALIAPMTAEYSLYVMVLPMAELLKKGIALADCHSFLASGLGGNIYQTYGRTILIPHGAALYVPRGWLAFPAVLPLTSPDADEKTPDPKAKKKKKNAKPASPLASLPYLVASIPNAEWMEDLTPHIMTAINEWNSGYMEKVATKRLWAPRAEWFNTLFGKLVT